MLMPFQNRDEVMLNAARSYSVRMSATGASPTSGLDCVTSPLDTALRFSVSRGRRL
jgi:hypothetical protein